MKYSISEQAFDHKPMKEEMRSLRFNMHDGSIDELAKFISIGHAYTSVMEYPSFPISQKKDIYFASAAFITFDLDHVKVPMKELITWLHIKPTIAYNTCSNGNGGRYSYRLIYALDRDITSKADFEVYSRSLAKMLDIANITSCEPYVDDNGTMRNAGLDENSFKCSQLWFGCRGSECIVNPSNVISLDSIEYDNSLVSFHSTSIINDGNVITKEFDRSLYNDDVVVSFFNNNFRDFLSINVGKCINLERTKIEIESDDIPIINYPNDYREIRRICRINKETGQTYIKKIKDGEGRRKMLFINGIIRRLITPSMTFGDVLYCLVYELMNYIINDGNKIDKHIILSIAKHVYSEDLEKYQELGKTERKFFVNPLFCEKYKMSKREVLNKYIGSRKSKMDIIGEVYDFSKSVNENHEYINSIGIDVSNATLFRFIQKHGNATSCNDSGMHGGDADCIGNNAYWVGCGGGTMHTHGHADNIGTNTLSPMHNKEHTALYNGLRVNGTDMNEMQRKVYEYLNNNSSDNVITVSQNELAKELKMSKRDINETVKSLIKDNLIKVDTVKNKSVYTILEKGIMENQEDKNVPVENTTFIKENILKMVDEMVEGEYENVKAVDETYFRIDRYLTENMKKFDRNDFIDLYRFTFMNYMNLRKAV